MINYEYHSISEIDVNNDDILREIAEIIEYGIGASIEDESVANMMGENFTIVDSRRNMIIPHFDVVKVTVNKFKDLRQSDIFNINDFHTSIGILYNALNPIQRAKLLAKVLYLKNDAKANDPKIKLFPESCFSRMEAGKLSTRIEEIKSIVLNNQRIFKKEIKNQGFNFWGESNDEEFVDTSNKISVNQTEFQLILEKVDKIKLGNLTVENKFTLFKTLLEDLKYFESGSFDESKVSSILPNIQNPFSFETINDYFFTYKKKQTETKKAVKETKKPAVAKDEYEGIDDYSDLIDVDNI